MTILVAETAVMFLLPIILPAGISKWVEAVIDALLLAFACAPVLWLTVFRPLREYAKFEKRKANAIVNSAVNPIITISGQGTIRSFNPAAEQLFGYSEAEVVDQNVNLLMPSPFREEHDSYLERYLKTGKRTIIGIGREVVGQKRDATTFPLFLSVSQVVNDNEMLFTGVIRDLTEQKAQEAKLNQARLDAEAANHAKSEFLANMSHEIRTPMTAILGFADILLTNVVNQENVDCAKTIKRNGECLIGIINDILDLSKIESGRYSVESTACSVHQVVADVASLMRVRAASKGLPLKVRFDGALPEAICSDPARLRQVLINIVGNAIKFTETGSVEIVTRLLNEVGDEPKLQFDVIDTGIGVPDDQIKSLFLPFTQADTSATRQFGGTGLGLSISQRLVELLGGEFSVSSTPGKGSTFSVTVSTGPLDGVRMIDNAAEAVLEAVAGAQKIESPLAGQRILLAEDGPDNQRLISYILKKAGADVTLADNGQIAVDLANAAFSEDCPFRVILMDMQMPVLDGYAAVRQLRNEGYTRPIIALTAHAMSDDRQRCLDAGCDDYATKPVDRKKVIALVAAYGKQTEVAAQSSTVHEMTCADFS